MGIKTVTKTVIKTVTSEKTATLRIICTKATRIAAARSIKTKYTTLATIKAASII